MLIDCTYRERMEEKEEEDDDDDDDDDWLTMKMATMHRYDDSRTAKEKVAKKTNSINQKQQNNTIIREQQYLASRDGVKNNCTDVSSDKIKKYHSKKLKRKLITVTRNNTDNKSINSQKKK